MERIGTICGRAPAAMAVYECLGDANPAGVVGRLVVENCHSVQTERPTTEFLRVTVILATLHAR